MFSMFFTLGVLCIHPVYFGLRPFAPFQYILLIKKNMHMYELNIYVVNLVNKQQAIKMFRNNNVTQQ